MTESTLGFLYNAATILTKSTTNRTQMLLKSYYLLRCKETTNRLPQKQFSLIARCPHCCIEWNSTKEMKVSRLRLSKKQRRRIRLRQKCSLRKKCEENLLIDGKVLEKVCSFCNHKTTSILESHKRFITKTVETDKKPVAAEKERNQFHNEPTNKTSVYTNSKQIFSLSNKNNTLTSIRKIEKKNVMKSNKKRKDKLAGLCQKAVLSANKMKHEKDKQNKLNLFLKPST